MTKHRTKKERREQILDAAVTCFSKKGYYETSMEDIVRTCGLSKGSLYWHFNGKRELFKALVELWFVEIAQDLPERVTEATSAHAKLEILVDSLKDTVAVRPELARAQLEFFAMSMRDDDILAWLRENYALQRAFVQSVLEEGMASGEFREAPAPAVARMLLAYLDGVFLHRDLSDAGEDLDAVLDEMKSTLFAVLRA